jgi:transposase
MREHASVPDDIAALEALLLQRDSEPPQLRSTVSTLEQALNVHTLEIEQLKLQIAKLKRMHFGRKSEKIDRKIGQLETRLEDLIAIEEQLRGQPPDRRQAIRQEQARPLLDDFEAWLRTRLLTL